MTTRRRFLAAALAALPATALLGACGDDETIDAGGSSPSTIEHPTGADDAVLRLDDGGGFVPEGYDFAALPRLVITGDGRVLTGGPMIEIFPGPAVPPLVSRTISEEGIQQVLERLDEAGLLTTPVPDYEPDPSGPQVADASTTTLVVNARGTTVTHAAYALGMDELDTTPARQALAEAVAALSDLPALLGDELGPEEIVAPDTVGVLAREATPEELEGQDGIEPQVVPWPEGAGDLSSATQCLVVDASALPGLEDWTQITRFTQGERTYTVWFRIVLPGDRTCPAEARA